MGGEVPIRNEGAPGATDEGGEWLAPPALLERSAEAPRAVGVVGRKFGLEMPRAKGLAP